jgi:hypothetical protein
LGLPHPEIVAQSWAQFVAVSPVSQMLFPHIGWLGWYACAPQNCEHVCDAFVGIPNWYPVGQLDCGIKLPLCVTGSQQHPTDCALTIADNASVSAMHIPIVIAVRIVLQLV